MKESLLSILACPDCADDQDLDLDADERNSVEVLSGFLHCKHCNRSYPITNGIPRFVKEDENYCENFGYQWNSWKTTQVDRLNGHSISEVRFFKDSRWGRDWIKGKLILDGGCGSGRFADVAASAGAHVVGLDISGAVDACREVTSIHDGRVQCVQGSLLKLPFKKSVFDGVYSMGVIMCTPDPEQVIVDLPKLVKPGGRIAYNFYEEGLWRRLQVIKYGLRLITPHLPMKWTLNLCRGLVAALFPLTYALSKVPKIRILNHFIPIACVHDPVLTREEQYSWTEPPRVCRRLIFLRKVGLWKPMDQ